VVSVTSAANPPIEATDDLVCSLSNTPSDLDGDVLDYTYHWYDDTGVLQQTYANTNATSDIFIGSGTTPGTWTCEIIVSDGTATSSASATIVVDSDWDGPLTFTNCGQTGYAGPSQSQCNTSYAGGLLAGLVSISSGKQIWTVPSDGTYRITAYGAQGGSMNSSYIGGKGASIQGDFVLLEGTQLQIVVGQQGIVAGHGAGGGGGSFVTYANPTSTSNILVIAAGGGGSNDYTGYSGEPGLTTTTAGNSNIPNGGSCANNGYGGSNGNGGGAGCAAGGGGFLGDGSDGSHQAQGGRSLLNGANGGISTNSSGLTHGGFGAGGAGSPDNGYGGGGGGFSGGGGGSWSPAGNGGGGGSYNAGTNQTNTAGVQTGHGYVVIDKL
jgi:hypothetical protein